MSKGISITSQLLSYVNYSDEKSVDRDIAKAILKNYNKIPSLTIYDLADVCFVSASSITRFIRTLGYQNYKEFKKEIQDTLKIDVDYSKSVHFATTEDLQPIFKRYTDHVIENIQYTYNNIDYEQLHRVAQMIHEADEIAFLGLEYANFLGIHFQNKMASLNKFIQIGVTEQKQLELAKNAHEGMLFIITSLEGSYFYRHSEILDILREKKCKIVAISMVSAGKVLNYCDEIIVCNKTNYDTEGRITLTYLFELLIMYYYINFSHL